MGRKPPPYPVIVQDSGVLCYGVTKQSEQKGPINISGLTTSLSDRKVDTVTCHRPQGPLKAQLCLLKSGMSLDFCKHVWIPHQQLLWLRKGTTATPVTDRQGGHQWAGMARTCLRKKSKQTAKMVPSSNKFLLLFVVLSPLCGNLLLLWTEFFACCIFSRVCTHTHACVCICICVFMYVWVSQVVQW